MSMRQRLTTLVDVLVENEDIEESSHLTVRKFTKLVEMGNYRIPS